MLVRHLTQSVVNRGRIIHLAKRNLSRMPLDLALFRNQQGLQRVRSSLKKRFRSGGLADQIAGVDTSVRQQRFKLEQLRKDINLKAKQLGREAKAGQMDLNTKQQYDSKSAEQKHMHQELKRMEERLAALVGKVGNIVQEGVNVSESEDQNREILKCGQIPNKKQVQPYWTVFQKLDAVDLKRGQKVAGHRGYFLKGAGVRLAQALTNYSLDFLEKEGYTLYQTPVMIHKHMMEECCQLNTLEEDMYKVEGDNTVLIATSEQPLACMYREEVIDKLPIKMGGYSMCFRKQAGAHGKDNQGLFRVHQFEKAQQFVICRQEDSPKHFHQMMSVSRKFYESLGLHFRIVQIVSGALNDAAAIKYDLEAWFPHSKKYRELVSVSNCTDYQSRMLNIRYRDKQNNKYVHMLNGTLCAVERTLCCILENYCSEDGVDLPEPLIKYYGSNVIKYKKC